MTIRKVYTLSMLQVYLGRPEKAELLRGQIEEFCSKYGMSISSLARRAIKKYIATYVPKEDTRRQGNEKEGKSQSKSAHS